MKLTLKSQALIKNLKNGAIAVIPTDTIYGLVGSALNPDTVERIYRIKKRRPEKPFIILISSLDDLKLFSISLDDFTKQILEKMWPGKVSILLPCNVAGERRGQTRDKFFYLHRGTNALAFRLPKKPSLQKLLLNTGPLVAPSANPERSQPAKTITEAREYFGSQVDLYVSGGRMEAKPSTLLSINKGKIKILRQGERNRKFKR